MTNLEKWKIEMKKEIDEVSNFKSFCGTVSCNACPIESRCLKEKDMSKEFDAWANDKDMQCETIPVTWHEYKPVITNYPFDIPSDPGEYLVAYKSGSVAIENFDGDDECFETNEEEIIAWAEVPVYKKEKK